MKTIAMTAGLLALTACTTIENGSGPPPAFLSGVELSVAPQSAGAGGTVPLTLANSGGQAVGYNLCLGALEQRVDGFWVPAPTDYKPCPAGYARLDPGERASGTTSVGATLDSGEYRYVTQVTELADTPVPELVRSNSFFVQGAAD